MVCKLNGDVIYDDGVYSCSGDFKLVKYTRKDMDKYFCIYLDSVFERFNKTSISMECFFFDEICYSLINSGQVAYSLAEKIDVDGEDIKLAMDYIDDHVIKEDYNNFIDYLINTYPKYGKYKMAIFKESAYWNETLCDYDSVDFFKECFSQEALEEIKNSKHLIPCTKQDIMRSIVVIEF